MTDNAGTSNSSGRRTFLKIGAGVVGGLVVGAAAGYVAKGSSSTTTTATSTLPGSTVTSTLPGSTVTSTLPGSTSTATATQTVTSTLPGSTITSTTTTSNTSEISSLQDQILSLSQLSGTLALSPTEATLVAALAETIMPTDSNGPGANEAGVVYFIDRMLAGVYGKNGNMYMQPPFVPCNLTSPVTVNGVTYSGGTTITPVSKASGMLYEYAFNLREFWRRGLQFLEDYSNSAYGGNFETLTAANQAAVVTDLFNGKPTNFTGPSAEEFIYEAHFMTVSGMFTDPLYGGNRGMVGWILTGGVGVNNGNFYNEGYTTAQLMVSSTPIRLQPASLSQLQNALNIL